MAIGQAQHCFCCGSSGIIMVGDQTLCAPCATPMRNEDGEYLDIADCPDCGAEQNFFLRESGYILCDNCWHDEIHPEYGEDLML